MRERGFFQRGHAFFWGITLKNMEMDAEIDKDEARVKEGLAMSVTRDLRRKAVVDI